MHHVASPACCDMQPRGVALAHACHHALPEMRGVNTAGEEVPSVSLQRTPVEKLMHMFSREDAGGGRVGFGGGGARGRGVRGAGALGWGSFLCA